MKGLKTVYICSNCTYHSAKWMGKCPSCNQWNTFVEDVISTSPEESAAPKRKSMNTSGENRAISYGELEIPVTTLLEGSVVISKSIQDNDPYSIESNIYCTSWKRFAEGEFRTVNSYIYNEYDGFKLSCDEEFLADYIVKFFPDDSITQIFLRGSTEEDENALLFTIRKLPKADVSESDYQLAVGDEYTYICEITENGEDAGITTSEIRNIFSLSAQ